MHKLETKNILVRVPVSLLKKLDRAAKKEGRSRTSEVCLRLEASLRPKRQEATVQP